MFGRHWRASVGASIGAVCSSHLARKHPVWSDYAATLEPLRYCWLWAFYSFDRLPCARWWRVGKGTSPRSARAAYVLGTSGGRPCASTWPARSILVHCGDGDGKGASETPRWATIKAGTWLPIDASRNVRHTLTNYDIVCNEIQLELDCFQYSIM